MTLVSCLRCRDCATDHGVAALARCARCGAQLDPVYDWDAIKGSLSRDDLERREKNMWRYAELLPLDRPPTTGLGIGWTPLVEAPTLADELGVGRIWVKCDSHSYPSLSFKDRVVAVAINKAIELGIDTVGCPSTGNLANAVAAHAAAAGLASWIFVPDSIEEAKTVGTSVYRPNLVRVRGTYDDVNRLTATAAERFGWGIVNVNLRPFYGEGSKTMAFETADQLGWRCPDVCIAPMAGGSLVTKLHKGFGELLRLGWVAGESPRIYGAQPQGCSPIVKAWLDGSAIEPVTPDTVARSLAIGNPVDGRWAVESIRDSRGGAVAVSDADLLAGIEFLARHTGIFVENAGGVVVAACRELARRGDLGDSDEVVLCITGNGMKTVEALRSSLQPAPVIEPGIEALEALL